MVAGCAPSCAKYCLYVFNVLFLLGGLSVMGIGLWMVLDTKAVQTLVRVSGALEGDDGSYAHNLPKELTPDVLLQGGYILIGAGACAALFSFLGCCGASRESQCLLSLYCVCLLVVLGLEVAVGIYAYVAKDSFEENAKTAMLSTLTEEYSNGSANAITFAWNRMMAELECCGVVDFRDFQMARFWKAQNPHQVVPVQCCKLKNKRMFEAVDQTCTQYPTEANAYLYDGCYFQLKHVLQTHVTILIYVGIGLGLSQLLGLLFTIILCCTVDPYK